MKWILLSVVLILLGVLIFGGCAAAPSGSPTITINKNVYVNVCPDPKGCIWGGVEGKWSDIAIEEQAKKKDDKVRVRGSGNIVVYYHTSSGQDVDAKIQQEIKDLLKLSLEPKLR